MSECFKCHREGHWAKDCDTQPCRKCQVPMDKHTQAEVTECAWRGKPCADCGFPPHPDSAPGRCAFYSSDDDTPADRAERSRSRWHRDPGLDPWRPAAERMMRAARDLPVAGRV
jgi:Zinc knuckle